jgi:hypothetical protein
MLARSTVRRNERERCGDGRKSIGGASGIRTEKLNEFWRFIWLGAGVLPLACWANNRVARTLCGEGVVPLGGSTILSLGGFESVTIPGL